MTTESRTDMGIGLGVLFGIVTVGAAVLTGVNSYNYAVRHALGLDTAGLLLNSGVGFAVAMLAASLSLVAIHVYDD